MAQLDKMLAVPAGALQVVQIRGLLGALLDKSAQAEPRATALAALRPALVAQAHPLVRPIRGEPGPMVGFSGVRLGCIDHLGGSVRDRQHEPA